MNQQSQTKISNSEYDTLIDNSLKNSSAKEKSITTGKIISIEKNTDNVLVNFELVTENQNNIPVVTGTATALI